MKFLNTKLFLHICIIGLILSLSIVAGCGKKTLSSNDVAVKINGYTLSKLEFEKLFQGANPDQDSPEMRRIFLENLIDRKLMLQDGERSELNKQKDFLESVQNFWEQSLLKIVLDKKISQISKDITITEEEIQQEADKWLEQNPDQAKIPDTLRNNIKWKITREKQSLALNAWLEGLRINTNIKINKKAIGVE